MLHFWTEIGSQLPVFSQIRSTPQFVSHPSRHPNDESPRLSIKGYRRTIRRFRSAIKPENPDAPGGITLDQLGVITEELWAELDKKLITQTWALGLAAFSTILAAVAGILAAL